MKTQKDIQKKTLKEALKNEVSPLLIGLRNEIKESNNIMRKIADKETKGAIDIKIGKKNYRVIKGDDGYTPVRGKDYWTDIDKAEIIKSASPIISKNEIDSIIKKVTPKKGIDYKDGDKGDKPVFGVDYWTPEQQKAFEAAILSKVTPIKGVHYRDGIDGVTTLKTIEVKLSATEIRNRLESLTGKSRLKIKAIDGLEEALAQRFVESGIGGSGSSGGGSTSTPGGSNKQMQFNDSGAFAGAANAYWDKVNNRFGLGTATPRGLLDVKKLDVQTISTPTVLTSLSFDYSGGNYVANGNYFEYAVFSYRTVGATVIYSPSFASFSGTDDGSTANMTLSFAWNAVSGAEGYRVVVVSDVPYGASSDYYFDTTFTSAVIDNGYDTVSANSYTSGPVVTPTSVTVGTNFYFDDTTGDAVHERGDVIVDTGRIRIGDSTDPIGLNSASLEVKPGAGNAYIEAVSANGNASFLMETLASNGGAYATVKSGYEGFFSMYASSNASGSKWWRMGTGNVPTGGAFVIQSLSDNASAILSTPLRVFTSEIRVAVPLTPNTNDGSPLGSVSRQWSDLFLAEGGVINWDNGDATLTQSGNTVTLAGAGFDIQGSLKCDSVDNDTGLAHGTYTPTITAVTNVSATTARLCTYMRVGNTVTVSGQLDIDPTATGITVVGISLPIASNFTTVYQLGGAGHAPTVAGHGASIMADTTNDRAQLSYVDSVGSNGTMTFTFTYQVV